MNYDDLLKYKPFGVAQSKKTPLLEQLMNPLTNYHKNHSIEYGRIISALGYTEKFYSLDALPFIPVGVFKRLTLKSRNEGLKEMVSSGTTNQQNARIFIDEQNAMWQQQTLINIGSNFIGEKRMPMLIIDAPNALRKKQAFSARGAGILGFSLFGSPVCYALNDDMSLNLDMIQEFVGRFRQGPVLVFGFTALIWEYFYKALLNINFSLDLKDGYLIHGGGWKKLKDQAVSNKTYGNALKRVLGSIKIINYYGMVEQTGSIYFECPQGHLHASTYSEVFVRHPNDFSLCKEKEPGIIQVISPMASAYPGHSILTEDLGIILGVDDCPCGRKGKYFQVLGRIPKAEIRGCSDTYEYK